jgi:hypothetical protein
MLGAVRLLTFCSVLQKAHVELLQARAAVVRLSFCGVSD